MGFTKLIRQAAEPQMLQSTGNPADSYAYTNADEFALRTPDISHIFPVYPPYLSPYFKNSNYQN